MDHCTECLTSLTHEDIPPAEARNRIEHALLHDTVADLHPARPITASEATPLDAAIERMRAERIGCLLITDAAGKLSGIFTERDLLNRIILEVADPAQSRVAEFMTRKPETIKAERPLAYALHRMMVGDLRHLPLVDAEQRAVGVISSRDIIRHLAGLVGIR
jgi:CBS domain-containing protein